MAHKCPQCGSDDIDYCDDQGVCSSCWLEMPIKLFEVKEDNKMTKHTKTPWKVWNRTEIEGEQYVLATTSISRHHKDKEEANAQFIVKAVNNHENLLKALKYTKEQAGLDKDGPVYKMIEKAIKQAEDN